MTIASILKSYLYTCCFGVLLFISMVTFASADTLPEEITLEGFAWSSNIGWISLNCENDNNCAYSDYKVKISTDRKLYGYAWSSNIGWIKFDNLGDSTVFPTGAGTAPVSAFATGTISALQLTGWARACAGTLGGDCSSTTVNPLSGGWDGWISLSGTTHYVKLNAVTGVMDSNSWAWGSDVVGWIDMHSYVSATSTNATDTATLEHAGCDIDTGSSTCDDLITWTIPNNYPSPNVYNLTKSKIFKSGYTGSRVPINLPRGTTVLHAKSGGNELDNVTALAISVDCKVGLTWDGAKCVGLPPIDPNSISPTVSINIIPTVVRTGGTATVTISILPTAPNSYTGTCKVTGPGLNVTLPAATSSVVVRTGPLKSRSLIQVTCTDDVANVPSYNPVTQKKAVDVIPVAQEI